MTNTDTTQAEQLTVGQKNLLRAAFLVGADSEHCNGSLYVPSVKRLIKADIRSVHALGDRGLVTWQAQSGSYTVRGRLGRGAYYARVWSGVSFRLTEEGKKLAAELLLIPTAQKKPHRLVINTSPNEAEGVTRKT